MYEKCLKKKIDFFSGKVLEVVPKCLPLQSRLKGVCLLDGNFCGITECGAPVEEIIDKTEEDKNSKQVPLYISTRKGIESVNL